MSNKMKMKISVAEEADATIVEASGINHEGVEEHLKFKIYDDNPDAIIGIFDDGGEDEDITIEEATFMRDLFNKLIEVSETKKADDPLDDFS